jgi:hypothetical protein
LKILFSLITVFVIQGFAQTLSYQEKLKIQWSKYSEARALLLQQVKKTSLSPSQRTLTRAQWESVLALTGSEALTPEDLAQLQNDQAQRIQKAKVKAAQESVIDLQQVRLQKQTRQFCEQVPKGGMLHIHPFGTLDRATAQSLLVSGNPKLELKEIFDRMDAPGAGSILFPPERKWLEQIPEGTPYLSLSGADQKQFENFLFLPPGKQPFPRFNGVFSFLGFAIADWPSYEKVLQSFVDKALKMGVIYVEFTTGTGPNLIQRVEALEKNTGITIRLNESFDRSDSIENIENAMTEFLKAPTNPYVVGIDFLDNEDGNPAFEKGQLLYGTILDNDQTGVRKLHRTMHAGEIGDIRNPRDAMILGAERLGHGVNLAKDIVAMEYAAQNKIPVEINISSNLRLTDVQSVSTHPVLTYLRLGLPVSLSTDDEGIFEIDINHECQEIVNETDISYAEFKKMAFNSIETSFASDADKQRLLDRLTKMFEAFEKQFKIHQSARSAS